MTSSALEHIKHEELLATRDGNKELTRLLGYAGQLGTALILVKFAVRELFRGKTRVVGFDEGDFVVIG